MLIAARTLQGAGLFGLVLCVACTSLESDTDPKQSDTNSAGGMSAAAPEVEPETFVTMDEAASVRQPAQDSDLIRQKNKILFDTHMANAQAQKENGDFEAALAQLEQAMQIDATNAEAIRQRNEVLEILGERPGEIATSRQVFEDRESVAREAARSDAEELHRMGQDARGRGEHDEAIRSFERVRDSIRWSPSDVEWGDLAQRNEDALSAARDERTAALDAEREKRLKAAFSQIKEDDEREAQRQRLRVANILESGAAKFERGDFDAAIDLAEEVLAQDPGNGTARDLKESSIDARRAGRAASYGPARKEAYRRWMQQVEELRIPYSEGLTPAPRDYWDRVMQRTSESEIGISSTNPENDHIRELLKTTVVPEFGNFEDNELDTVVSVLQTFSGIPILATPAARDELESSGELITLPSLTGLNVEAILKILTANLGENIAWSVRDGVVVITTTEDAFGEAIIRTHPMQDLTFPLTNFKGPKIDHIPMPGQYGDDAETTVFNSDLEGEQIIQPEDIQELIRTNVAPETWDSDKFSIDIAESNQLVVIHTPEVQRQVAEFLDDLRRFSSTVVQIESRFIDVTDGFIEEFAADFRGLGGVVGTDVGLDDTVASLGSDPAATRGLDNLGSGFLGGADPTAGIFFNDNSDGDIRGRTENIFETALGDVLSTVGGGSFQISLLDDTEANLVLTAVSKSVNATEVMAPILTVFNTERAYVTVINEVSFLQDFDVDVANTAFIANPEVGIIQEGVVLDVKPTISYDRKYIMLDISTTVAEMQRPIPTFTTTLGGFTDAVTFEMPILRVDDANTTVKVPDGGSILLGGLRTVRHINRKATTPFLGNIPIIGFFFSRKGVSDEAQSTTIMVRASIKDLGPYRESLPLR